VCRGRKSRHTGSLITKSLLRKFASKERLNNLRQWVHLSHSRKVHSLKQGQLITYYFMAMASRSGKTLFDKDYRFLTLNK